MSTATALVLSLDNLRASRAPLFHRYPREVNPQPAFVLLSEEGEVSADSSGEIGNGVPASVWHGCDLRFPVSPSVSGSDLADYLERFDRGRALLERIHEGHSVEWDGSNHVGHLDDDAQAAREELEAALLELGGQQPRGLPPLIGSGSFQNSLADSPTSQIASLQSRPLAFSRAWWASRMETVMFSPLRAIPLLLALGSAGFCEERLTVDKVDQCDNLPGTFADSCKVSFKNGGDSYVYHAQDAANAQRSAPAPKHHEQRRTVLHSLLFETHTDTSKCYLLHDRMADSCISDINTVGAFYVLRKSGPRAGSFQRISYDRAEVMIINESIRSDTRSKVTDEYAVPLSVGISQGSTKYGGFGQMSFYMARQYIFGSFTFRTDDRISGWTGAHIGAIFRADWFAPFVAVGLGEKRIVTDSVNTKTSAVTPKTASDFEPNLKIGFMADPQSSRVGLYFDANPASNCTRFELGAHILFP
jgi:hypothetical protein